MKRQGAATAARPLTKAQLDWCENYRRATTFEPLLDDFLAGNETFEEAARGSVKWFEEWFTEAYASLHLIPAEDA